MTKKTEIIHDEFAREYVNNKYNAKQAYLFIKPNVSSNTAEVEGHKMLSNPKVAELVEKYRESIQEELGIRKSELIDWLREIVENSLATEDSRAAIAGIAQISKMLGFDAETKSSIKVDDKREITKSLKDIQDALKEAKNPD